MKRSLRHTVLLGIALTARIAVADPVLYVGDSNGRLAEVDVPSGAVTIIGSMGTPLTDIAFAPNGELFGLDTTDFYRVNPETGGLTLIGPHGIRSGNALTFGSDGTLYAAGESSTTLFRIDPVTGQSTILGNTGFRAAGDLAFNGGQLYMSSLQHQLIRIDSSTFTATAVGNFGVSGVLGLATAADGVLYGVAGTRIFSVNTATGLAIEMADFRGQGLSGGFGATVVPEPTSYALVVTGCGIVLLARRIKRQLTARMCSSETPL